jgi:hypothetical protein
VSLTQCPLTRNETKWLQYNSLFSYFRKKMQSTNRIFMVRPAAFRWNEQTAINNYYQKAITGMDEVEVSTSAQNEFDAFVDKLRSQEIEVEVFQDSIEPNTPDSLFPNNWISFHIDQKYVLYPMYANNRRLERSPEIMTALFNKASKSYTLLDLSYHENQGLFLEGTGSLVLDREHKIAYACISERTNEMLVRKWCNEMGFKPILFHAYQTVNGQREPIYHTNVMLSIGTDFCVVCSAAVDNSVERFILLASLEAHGRKVINISEDQMSNFAGNMLELKGFSHKCIVMSTRAFHSLDESQRFLLGNFGKIIHTSLDVIETHGGGSARCMIAELF